MHDYEIRLAQRRVIERGLQQRRIRAALQEVVAAARRGMNVNSQAQPAGLLREVVKQKILQLAVLRAPALPRPLRMRS